MESGWNVWVWPVGVVSRRRVWLVAGVAMGLASRGHKSCGENSRGHFHSQLNVSIFVNVL